MFQLFIVHSDENSARIMSARTRGSNSIADPLIWTRADIANLFCGGTTTGSPFYDRVQFRWHFNWSVAFANYRTIICPILQQER